MKQRALCEPYELALNAVVAAKKPLETVGSVHYLDFPGHEQQELIIIHTDLTSADYL